MAELAELVRLAELAQLGELGKLGKLAALLKRSAQMPREMTAPGPVQLLVLQPTPFCNLDCSYCYLPNRHSTARMNWTTLELAVERVLESPFAGETLSVVWHAGEPLVLPVDWYDEAFERIETINSGRTTIQHNVQTNGVLLNDRWISLFQRHCVRLGLSLDGPAHLHDAYRKTRSGAGTHQRVMKSVELLNASALDYHVICVLTSGAMEAPEELHEFFRSYGVRNVGFNVEEIEGLHTSSSLAEPKMVEAYRSFLRRTLALSKQYGTPQIRELAVAHNLVLRRDYNPWDNHQVVPLRIVSVGVDGQISTFSPELLGNENQAYGDFIFGNVTSHGLADVLADSNFRMVHTEIQSGVRACHDACPYFMTCGGGAPANKVFEMGRFDVTETMFCRLTCQAPVDVVLADLEVDLGLAN